MAGVRIGDGAVIAARAVVTRGCPALHHRRRRAGQGDPQAFRRGHRSQVAGDAMVGLAHRENPRKSAPHHAGRDRETHRRIGFARGNGLKHSDLSTAERQSDHGRKTTNPRPKGNLPTDGSVSPQRIFKTLRRRGPVSPQAGIAPGRQDTPLRGGVSYNRIGIENAPAAGAMRRQVRDRTEAETTTGCPGMKGRAQRGGSTHPYSKPLGIGVAVRLRTLALVVSLVVILGRARNGPRG